MVDSPPPTRRAPSAALVLYDGQYLTSLFLWGGGSLAQEIAAFYDKTIGVAESLEFLFDDGFACGNEVAFTGLIRTVLGGHVIDAEGVFTYKVDDAGKIVALRAFWEVDRAMATARPVAS